MADYLSRPTSALQDCEQSTEPLYEVTDSGNSSMKVVVRVRPESEAELRSSCQCVVKVLDDHVLVFDPAGNGTTGKEGELKKSFAALSSPGVSRFFGGRRLRPLLSKKHKDLRFAFDHVFDETTSQSEVFHHTAYSIIEGVLDGINCSIFAYGATGAGKTHTMLGHPEDPGVIFLTMMELYRRIDSMKSTKTCHVTVSYCEVYNETIRDLLVPSGSLSLREDSQKGLVVAGLSCHTPETAEEILGMLEKGNNNRTQHPTEANATSSRSHAVFQVFVEQRPRTAGLTTEVTQGKMSLIDLAGSERATMTSNRGARLREGANINRSLLALGNCINALASDKGKSGYVPYRDSKLTRLLKDSLGGNCRTVMVANVSPSALSFEDTYNTLKYADRAKQIKTTLVRNVLQVDYHMTKYRAIIQDLRKEISELKLQIQRSSPQQETFDPSEANRLCEMVKTVYGERGRLRKHMADLDAKEREALLKVCRKERDLNRIDTLSANEAKKLKIKTRLEALRCHVTDIQRQKQTVNEYLYSNNESVGRVQGVVNAACRAETGGNALQRLLEVVTEAKKLEVENAHQWKQTKHLLKYIKNQEREIAKTERILGLALSLVRNQQRLIKSSDVNNTSSLQDDIESLTHLADGDKGVVWADQTRISTNDLQDVNVSNFSLTQQQLFNCFLEHSSPRVRGGFPRDSPQLYPSSLSILTSTSTSRGEGILQGGGPGEDTPSIHSSLQDLRVSSATPTSRTNSNGTVTVRASHTISSTSPHRNADSAPGSGGSVTVTTDVCISSDLTDGGDDHSEGSSSGVGTYNTTSEPSQEEVDYDKLDSKREGGRQPLQGSRQPPQREGSRQLPQLRARASSIPQLSSSDKTRRAAFDLGSVGATPISQGLYRRRPVGTPFLSRTLDRLDVAGVRDTSLGRPGGVARSAGAPQPYSMFQPFHPPARRSQSSTHVATPHSGPSSLSSQHSISAESGIGQVTALPRKHGALLIPNRPLANGFMVRSSPSSSSGYYSNSQYYTNNRFSGFDDNFVSPRQQQAGVEPPGTPRTDQPPGPNPHMAAPMKAPIGALRYSSLPTPFSPRVMATPNPYVQAPSHQTRPPHVYQSINIPGPTHPLKKRLSPPSPTWSEQSHQSHHSNSAAADNVGSKGSPTKSRCSPSRSQCILSDLEEEREPGDLNSTFTVEVGVAKSHPAPTSSGHRPDSSMECGTEKGGKKAVQGQQRSGGRGLFSRSRSPSKIPSYLKMTKSAESKKVSRVQNKENLGQPVTSSTSGLIKRFNLNRSRDRINAESSSASGRMGMSRFSSAPQLAW